MPAPVPNTIEALRVTLQKLEQNRDAYSSEAFAELKRIILNRIAELELTEAIAAQPTAPLEPGGADSAIEPVPPPAVEAALATPPVQEEMTPATSDAQTDLGKLD